VLKKSGKTVIKIAVAGATGRMGHELLALIGQDPSLAVAGEIGAQGDWKKLKAAAVDIVVDFSTPEGLAAAAAWAVENRKPLVSGTTGLSAKEKAKLKDASAKIPVLYSANMSMGIAVLSSMLEQLGKLEGWDFQIEEAHHKQKKDSPSGTALLLQEKLAESVKSKLPAPNAIRGGGIPGIHQVWAMGPDETLVLQHTAFNRTVFARGALYAARWLFDKKQPGLYDLSDLYKK
jgi:4-hydroxy-tetrahydrodipicolinate reductase